MALAGGTPVTLADAPSILGGTWAGREIIFAGSPSGGLMRVPADGGEPQPLTTPAEASGEVRHAWPALVPNQRVLLFTIDTMAVDGTHGVMGAVSLEAAGSVEVSRWRTLVAGVDVARAAAADTIVFSRGAEIEAIAFDPLRVATAGVPRAVVAPVGTAQGLAQFAVSPTGSLVWVATPASTSAASPGLAWWSPSGFQAVADEVRRLRGATLSPDGTRVAGVNIEGARADVWIIDVRRGTATRLTHSGINTSPVWSADGRTVYFASRADGAFELWKRDAEGILAATRLTAAGGSRHALPLAASPDGSMLAFQQTTASTRADIRVLPLDAGPARTLVSGAFDDTAATFSPDAKLLAFQAADTGRWEIYVQRLRDGRRIVVSTDGGERPHWGPDGLYFQSRGQLMRAAIAGADSMRVESVTRLANLFGATLQGIAPDARVLVRRDADMSPAAAVVSLEWLREVRALLGPPAAALPR